ncbi:MAG TPA: CYTH and CHAD domain-containing protein [Streptosporangiaceae bacterium]|nr:CYTH and CHAD domain-containing protein [Streptosporangiaceae bacterium]
MAVTETETETKYEAGPGTALPRLDTLPNVAAARGPDEQQLVAEYYDTADLRLLDAGITLRRRTGGGDAGWHLKLPVAPGSREEIRLPPGRAGGRVPAELADLVGARTRGAPLVPVAAITTLRRVTTLVGQHGESLAEVADDSVRAVPLLPEVPAKDTALAQDTVPATEWREIEVELTGGDSALLAAADNLLRDSGLQRSARSAKLEHVLGERPPRPASPAELTPSASAGVVIGSYLRSQAEQLKWLDPKVRRAEPDSVHQMRVASRRLRGALRSFGAVVSRPQTDHVAAELKWLGGVLGEARDAEVQAERLDEQVRQTDAQELLGPVQARVQAHGAMARAASLTAVSAALKSERYYALLDELDELTADLPAGPAARESARQALPAAVARSYRKTRRRMRTALKVPAGAPREAALHDARKAAKQARYAAEAVAPVLGRDAARFGNRMKKLQTVLGDHQDTVVGRQLARRLGVAAQQAGESAFSYGLFYGRDACEGARLQAKAANAWREASRARYRHWLR